MVTRRLLEAYWTLCKPKVVLLMLLTAWVGMLLAPGSLPLGLTLLALLGIGFAASSGVQTCIRTRPELHGEKPL